MRNLYLILLIAVAACNTERESYRDYLPIEGEWQFALDTLEIGETEKWYLTDLDGSVILPGTTDQNKKGFPNTDTTTLHLNRVYTYEGMAWYRKKVTIPESFRNRNLSLFLERTKTTKIWVDSIFVGTSHLLQSPQRFDVSEYLNPGIHHITILVNNDLELTPYGNVHIYTDHTQTNWNGIIGKTNVEATARTYISDIKITPNIEEQKIDIDLSIDNQLNLEEVDVELLIEKTFNGTTEKLRPKKTTLACREQITLEYDLGNECSLWDEHEQPLYQLTAVISNGKIADAKTAPFGMREFEATGAHFSVNGRTVFLRGKQDAAVFPTTGFTPMDMDEWMRVFRIARSYGINHYRFHSYCPPEAAFTAADRMGIYLQPELPFWGGLESDTLAAQLRKEGFAMLDAYANHPSFVMFSHGNEIWSGLDRVEENIATLKAYDDRPLYTMGSNNNIGYVPPREISEFYIGARTPYAHDTTLTHLRLTHAFADSREGGILNSQKPSTEVNFDYAVSQIDIPVISHEIGQYQIYPDYDEIDKYTGVLRARNLEKFRQDLQQSGMAGMDSIFQQASGAWSALCYKAEMEAALRTEGLAGFQLLDLQDFSGQGTALVGILDAFMDPKDVITPDKWKQSCNDVVLLLEFPKYCWTNNETFSAELNIANYSGSDITGDIAWMISAEDGEVIDRGEFSDPGILQGGITRAGEIRTDLSSVHEASNITLSCSIAGTAYNNRYDLWVYPSDLRVSRTGEIVVTEELNHDVLTRLISGEKVLYFPCSEDISHNSVEGLFPPDFWNYGMFKDISLRAGNPVSPGTLGLLMDPEHPLFNDFPTDFHTNWQWFTMIKNSNPMILNSLPGSYYPIVQVIDNLERNHKLGIIFEFRVGNGKLLVCTSRLHKVLERPEARQLYHSIIEYMKSDAFEPDHELSADELLINFGQLGITKGKI